MFPDKKKKAMAIDEDPFPPMASINTASFDLRALIESNKFPNYCLLCVDKLKNEWSIVCTDLH